MIKKLVVLITLISFQFLALGCSKKESRKSTPAKTTTESPTTASEPATAASTEATNNQDQSVPTAVEVPVIPGASVSNQKVLNAEVNKGIAKAEATTQLENKKVELNAHLESLKAKQNNIKSLIDQDYIVLNSRFAELNYLADFLHIDKDAQKSVARSVRSVKRNNPNLDVAAISAVVFVPSFTVYALSKYGLPALKPTIALEPQPDAVVVPVTRTQEFMARTKAATSRIYNSVRDNIKNEKLHNATGVMALTSAIAGGLALTSNYVSTKRYKDSVETQTQIYLSQLATDNQDNFLTYSQIDKIFTARIKEKSFSDRVATELNDILTEIRGKTNDIRSKNATLSALDQQKESYEKQLDHYDSQIKRLK